MQPRTTVKITLFVLSCFVSGAIFMDNHPLKKLSFRLWPFPHISYPVVGITRRVTDVMALLSVTTAIVCLFGKSTRMKSIYAHII